MKKDEITQHLQLLNIDSYPFSKTELTKAFKDSIFRYHPDRCKDKDAEEKTKSIIDAYNKLKPYAGEDIVIVQNVIKERSLFEFTKQCKHCEGKGSVLQEVRVKGHNCIKCKDTGVIKVKCNKCNNGKFTLKSGRIVDCLTCKGTGIYSMRCNHRVSYYEQMMNDLFGHNRDGFITKKVTCTFCGGSGETSYEPVNPVIRKGAILK